jgi:hypothetical protein
MKLTSILFLLIVLTMLGGCNGPMAFIPGGALKGQVASASGSNWQMAAGFENLELETTPEEPYSVRVNFTLRDGNLYVDPGPERTWYSHLASDSNVRVRFADVIYPAMAVVVENPQELDGFESGKVVFRLEPR